LIGYASKVGKFLILSDYFTYLRVQESVFRIQNSGKSLSHDKYYLIKSMKLEYQRLNLFWLKDYWCWSLAI